MAPREDDQEKMKESFKEVNKKMNEMHMNRAKTIHYSSNPANAQMDMAKQILDEMPEGKKKNELKKGLESGIEAMKEGETEMRMKLLMKALFGGREEERYGDGVQTIVVGREVEKLSAQWRSGMDYHPSNLSLWMRTIYFGDFKGMMAMLDDKSEAQVKQQLELRESMMNMNSVLHVVCGAKVFYSDKPAMLMEVRRCEAIMEVKRGHIMILKKLIELGANISAKDMSGCTALHHCYVGYGNAATAAMSELLLQAGADPNLQDRAGLTALYLAVTSADLAGVSLLLKHGGDPDVKEYSSGYSSRSWAFRFPAVNKLIAKSAKKDVVEERRQQREAAGGSLAACRACGAGGGTRCAGCFVAHYCNPACQKKDWKKHRVSCKETRAKYQPAKLKTQAGVNLNYRSQKVKMMSQNQKLSEGLFVVKVQVPVEEAEDSKPLFHDDLLVYNKDRSLMGFLVRVEQQELYDKLVKLIREHGFQKYKAFFPAIYKKDAAKKGCFRLEINPEEMLLVETW